AFKRLADPYPPRWRARMAARRAVALTNLNRADAVICLSSTMADLVSSRVRAPVHVSKITSPMDIWTTTAPADTSLPAATHKNAILVPGTITWYKRPDLALQIASQIHTDTHEPIHVFFAGRDDGTGTWQHTKAKADAL